MVSIVGIVTVIVMVFGGYLAGGGKMAIIVHALPFEMMIIGGAAVGAFAIGNDGPTIMHTLKDLARQRLPRQYCIGCRNSRADW